MATGGLFHRTCGDRRPFRTVVVVVDVDVVVIVFPVGVAS